MNFIDANMLFFFVTYRRQRKSASGYLWGLHDVDDMVRLNMSGTGKVCQTLINLPVARRLSSSGQFVTQMADELQLLAAIVLAVCLLSIYLRSAADLRNTPFEMSLHL